MRAKETNGSKIMLPGSLIINMKIGNVLGKLENVAHLPSLYIFCQPEDLETLDLDEQWEGCTYEDNSFPLPV
jgi:hypothetical protein